MFELEIDSRMNFEFYFSNQLKRHPSIEYQDVIKLCYQAAFGAEHLLSDIERAREYLYAEFESVSPTSEPLLEYISSDIVRVNLGAWKREGYPIEELFEAFCNSAYLRENSKDAFFSYLEIAESVMIKGKSAFVLEEWRRFVSLYLQDGVRALHHSKEYRECEKPSYRIIRTDRIKEEWI